MLVKGGDTDVTTYFMMRLAADGTAATGLTATTFDLQYTRSGAAPAAKVDATLNGNGVGGNHSDSTVIEVDATSSPGLYRVDWVDAAFAAGVREVILVVKVATAFTEPLRVELDGPMDAIWDEALTGAKHNVATSAGKRIRTIDAAFEVHSGTAQAGSTSTTIKLDVGASAVDNIYRGDRIIIIGGTGQEEHGICISYVGSTQVATMAETWVVTPDNTSEFEVVPASVDIETVQHAVQTAGDLAALIAAVKVLTDKMVFTKANELDVNTKSINDAEVVGDGNATPWDGA